MLIIFNNTIWLLTFQLVLVYYLTESKRFTETQKFESITSLKAKGFSNRRPVGIKDLRKSLFFFFL